MLIKTNNKKEAIHAWINEWLKDKSFYCNNCGENFTQGMAPCCENMMIGNNVDFCMGVIKQNRMIQHTRSNQFASTDDKSLRFGASIPPRLMKWLDQKAKIHGYHSFFENGRYKGIISLNEFMKEFQQFKVCEVV